MKKFFLYNLKRFIPLYAVSLAIFLSFYFSIFASNEAIRTINSPSYYSSYSINSGIILMSIPLAIFTAILPFFANSYRYSLNAADTFYQIGKDKRMIRFTNNLTLLGACLLSFTTAFIIGMILLLLKQVPTAGTVIETTTYGDGRVATTEYYMFNFFYYLPTYLLLVIGGCLNYFISYFFVTRANNLVNSMIMLVLGQLIIGIGVMTPVWYLSILLNSDVGPIYNVTIMPATRSAGIVGFIALIHHMFNSLIIENGNGLADVVITNSSQDVIALILAIVCLVLFVGFGVLGLLFFLKEKESSGELAGKAPGRDKFQMIIFHIGFGIIGLWVNASQALFSSLIFASILMLISEIFFFGAIYYVFTGLIRRNFKINKSNLFIMIGSLLINLTLGIIMMVKMVDTLNIF